MKRVGVMRHSRPYAAAVLLAACAPRPDAVPPTDSTGGAAAVAAASDSGAVRTPLIGGPAGDPAAFTPSPAPKVADSIYRMRPTLVPVPAPLRGLYVNRWAAMGGRMNELIDLAKRTEVNALVIDVKDDRGFVLYPSRVALAREIGADKMDDTVRAISLRRARALVDTLRANGIYPIARIVIAKDPLLASRRNEWAIRRKSDGAPWLDDAGNPWLDPHRDEVWNYAADLAMEAVDIGFSEVQFDYVRFPDDKRLIRESTFPLANGRSRAQVIHDQLARIAVRLDSAGVRMAIDVFGLTTSDTTDMGIGQRWELFVDIPAAVHPMMYPSHYAHGSYGFANPNANPSGVIDHGLKDAKHRTESIPGAAQIVPWYQDFTLGLPHYGAAQVRAQIQAGYDNGVQSWILWNPRSVYSNDALQPANFIPPPDSVPTARRNSAATPPVLLRHAQ